MPLRAVDRVQAREDWWVDVPAHELAGLAEYPIQLRPGSGEDTISIKIPGARETEVDLSDLKHGIEKVEREADR